MLAAAGAMMAGCAEQSSFPSFGTVVPVGNNVLTPEQRQERERMIEEIIGELIAEGNWR